MLRNFSIGRHIVIVASLIVVLILSIFLRIFTSNAHPTYPYAAQKLIWLWAGKLDYGTFHSPEFIFQFKDDDYAWGISQQHTSV